MNLRPVCRIEGRVIADKLEWARGKRLVFTSEQLFEGPRPPWPTEGRADVATDAEGRFVVPVIAAGRISRIVMVVDDELPVRPELPQRVDLPASETTVLEIPMLGLVDIRGSIVAEDTGEPLAGIEAHVYYGKFFQGTDVISDAKGQFSARVLPGQVRFQVMNLSKTKYLQLGYPPSHDVPDDADGLQLPAITVVASKPLEGRLVDENDSPVADANIYAYYNNWLCSSAKSDENGRFVLPKMPPSVEPDEATYRVGLGIGETRFMRDGGVEIVQPAPLVLRVKR